MKILVVEDERTVAQTLQLLFSNYNYAVDIAADGESGLQMVDAFEYDLILLDVNLPKLDGITLCKQLRDRGFKEPILLLTGQGASQQKAIALNAGADDYVVKPFDAEELIARVQALLRRGKGTREAILSWGKLAIDPSRRQVTYDTSRLSVTPKEYAILELFLRAPQKAFNASTIIDRVWTSLEYPGEEAVRVHIKELRQKLKAAGAPKDFIKTRHRVGYQLNPLYSSTLADRVKQEPTLPQVAELTSVNEELRLALEQLQESQAKYRTLFNSIDEGFSVCELVRDESGRAVDYRFLEVNPAAERIIGIARRELIGRLNTEIFPGIDSGQQRTYQQVVDANESIRFERYIEQLDRWFDVKAFPYGGDRFALLYDEITDRKRTEAALQESQTQLTAKLAHAQQLQRLSSQLIPEANVQSLYQQILDAAIAIMEADMGTIQMLDPERNELQLLAHNGLDPASAIFWQWVGSTAFSACSMALNRRDRVIIPDVEADDSIAGTDDLEAFRASGIRATQSTPLLARDGSVVGAISTQWRSPHQPGEWELNLLEVLARQVSDLIERTRTQQEVESDLRNTQLLHALATQLIVEEDAQSFYEEILTAAIALMAADAGTVQMLERADGELVILAHRGFEPQMMAHFHRITASCQTSCGRALATGDRAFVDFDVPASEDADGSLKMHVEAGYLSAQSTPLISRAGKLIGMVSTHWRHHHRPSDRQLHFLDLLARQAADAIEQKQIAAALQEREELLRSMTQAGAWSWEVVTGKLTWSPQVYRLHGIDPAKEPIDYDRWFNNCLHPEDRPKVTAYLEEVVKQRPSEFQLEHRILHPQKGIRCLLSLAHPLWSDRGELLRMSGIIVDISERKEAEIALQQSEARFRHFAENSHVVIWIAKPASLENEYLSPAYETIWGRSIRDPSERPESWLEAVHPDDRHIIQAQLEQKNLQSASTAEYRILRPDGAVRWISNLSFPIRNEAGEIYAFGGMAEDISARKLAEIALQQSEEQLSQIMDSAIGSIARFQLYSDLSWQNDYFSKGSEGIYGYQPEEFMAQPMLWLSRVDPEDRESLIAPALEKLAAGESAQIEYRFQHQDGSWRWLSTRYSPRPTQPNGWQVTSVTQDITDRKLAEIALQQSEAKFRHFAENSHAVIWIAQPNTLEALYISPAYETIWGRSCQSAIARPESWLDSIHPEDRDRVQSNFIESRQQGASKLEYRIVRPDGSIRWIEDWGFAIRNEVGEVYSYGGIAEDITDRKLAEIALQQSETRFSAAFNSAAIGMSLADLEGNFTQVNPAFCEITGYCEAEVVGMNFTAITHPDDIEGTRDRLSQLLAGEISFYYLEKRYLHKQGRVIWVFLSRAVVRDEFGQPVHFIGQIQDITQRKEAERALQESQAQLSQIVNSEIVAISQFRVFSDGDWEYDYLSKGCEILYGYSAAEMMADKTLWLSRVPPEDREAIIKPILSRLLAEENVAIEHRMYHKNGSLLWLSTLHTSRQIAADCWQVTAATQDTTDRKLAEMALKESEARLSASFDYAAIGMAMCNLQGRFIRVNSAFCEITGYREGELLARDFLAITHPEEVERDRRYFQQLLSGEIRYYHVEKRYVRKQGHLVWAFVGVALVRDERGQPLHSIAQIQNISDRKQAEFRLQQQIQQERLVDDIARDIRQSLELERVLSRTVERVRQVIQSDRAVVFRFRPDWYAEAVVESVGENVLSLLGTALFDPCFQDRYAALYCQGHISTISDLDSAELEPCYRELLRPLHVRANLTVPIVQGNKLWGLLIAHHCHAPHDWQTSEIELLQQLATQIGIAIQQSELYEQTRRELQERERMQAILTENEERFRTLSTAAPIGICQIDACGICLYANARWQEILGLSDEDALGYGWLQNIHPEDREAIALIWDNCLRGDCETLPEFRLLTPLGETRWIAARIAPMTSALGEIIGYVGIAEDITERRAADAKLRDREAFLSSIYNGAQQGIFAIEVTEAREFRYLSFNRLAEEYTGIGDRQARGKTPEEVFGLAVGAAFRQNYQRCLQAGTSISYEEQIGDGEQSRWMLATLSPLRDEGGRIYRIVGTAIDINDRKLAEQIIQEQAALLDITSDAIFARDFEHRILYWNRGAERMYGWLASSAIGRDARELLRENPERIAEITQTLLEGGEWHGELRKFAKTGREIIIEGRWTLARDAMGQPRFILTVNTDITEKKQLEAQFYRAQRLESLGTLASGIAHDLNNVLTPVVAISQVLRLRLPDLDARSLEMLKVLEDSAKRGAKTIERILTFTRGTGEDLEPVAVDLLVGEVAALIEKTLPKAIAIRKRIPSPMLWWVSANSTHLHQVLMNLCVNARDAMPEGGILSLSVEHCFVDIAFTQTNLEARVGNYVVVTVADTGTGIPPEVQDRIFEPFFTTKPHGQGTGLGLATVLGIVKNYGGFVQVSSEVGRGTEVRVYLPAVEGNLFPVSEGEVLVEGQGETILLVDDDAGVLESTRSLLERHHYQVLSASNGAEAIALYERHPSEIRAAIVDMMMPEMSGISLIQQLKEIDPDLKTIAMSGLSTYRTAALAAGANLFLAKPYLPEVLLARLQALLNNRPVTNPSRENSSAIES